MSGNDPKRPDQGDDHSGDLGRGWLSEPEDQHTEFDTHAPASDDELGTFLRSSIPAADDNYWRSIERRLDPDAAAVDARGEDAPISPTSTSRGDELHRFLHHSVPTPGPGYWESITRDLTAIERGQDHMNTADTDESVVRPMTMKTETSPTPKRSRMLAAAAALVLLTGVGTFAAINRGGGDDGRGVELATQPETAATVEAATEGGSVNDDTGSTDGANDTTTAVAPLTTMQTRLAGSESDIETLFCFAAPDTVVVPIEDPSPGLAVVYLSVQPNGSYSFLALQNDSFLITAAGEGSGDGVFETVPVGIEGFSGLLPPYLVTLTDTSISFGSESVLPLVSCTDVEPQIQLMRTTIEEAQNEPGGLTLPEGAATALEAGAELAPISDDQVLSSGGLGPIRIGMRVSELEANLGVALETDTIEGDQSAGNCGWIRSNLDQDVFVIVETTGDGDAIVRRISTRANRWATPSGLRVGMTEQQVIDAFPGQLDITPHIYVEDGQYLTFVPTDPTDPNTVEFVTEFGVLTELRAGADRWVSLAEGCA